jgi:hypothetical protein
MDPQSAEEVTPRGRLIAKVGGLARPTTEASLATGGLLLLSLGDSSVVNLLRVGETFCNRVLDDLATLTKSPTAIGEAGAYNPREVFEEKERWGALGREAREIKEFLSKTLESLGTDREADSQALQADAARFAKRLELLSRYYRNVVSHAMGELKQGPKIRIKKLV